MSIFVKWDGLERIDVSFGNASAKGKSQAIKVLKNNAEKGKSIAQGYAPKDTGFLKGQIKTNYTGDGAEIRAEAGYSGFQEYGTRYQSGTPFMRPMLKDIEPLIKNEMQKVMKGLFK